MKRIALIGNNIRRSFSPYIHNYYYDKLNINATYELINLKSKSDLKKIVAKIKYGDIFAANITSPFKQEIIKYLDDVDVEAKDIGSVNCISLINGKKIGQNTDFFGLIKTIETFRDYQDVIIIGNGGVVPTVIKSLNYFKQTKIHIIARKLIDFKIKNCNYYDIRNFNIQGKDFLIINTLPMSTNLSWVQLLNFINGKIKYAFDLNYHKNDTKFLNSFNRNIIKRNGLNMLIFQALKSIDLWFDKNLSGSVNVEEFEKKLLKIIYGNKL